jgi:hypothetical protein
MRDHLSRELSDALQIASCIDDRADQSALADPPASRCILQPLANDFLKLGSRWQVAATT